LSSSFFIIFIFSKSVINLHQVTGDVCHYGFTSGGTSGRRLKTELQGGIDERERNNVP